MATLTAQKSVEAGTTITLASAAGGGDEFVNTGVEFLLVDNQHGSASYNVTITYFFFRDFFFIYNIIVLLFV